MARIKPEPKPEVDIFCRYDAPASGAVKLADLPSAQNLGTFCYPTGPANVRPREYAAPEVRQRSAWCRWAAWANRQGVPSLPCTDSVTLAQEFSFTLTGGDGSRTHGFCRLSARANCCRPAWLLHAASAPLPCRTFLPPRLQHRGRSSENSNLRYPQVLCIISSLLWLPFYFKVHRLFSIAACA